jgi:5-methylthioadenosine/S-adenosylhomocysteine deaminase
MSGRDVLIKSGYLATGDRDLGDLHGTDILVRDGLIAEIGVGLAAPDALEVDARRRLVLPGFVDTHRHLWLGAISASVAVDSLAAYSRAVMGPFAGRYRPEDVYAGVLWGALLALNAGVTTVADWAHNLPSSEHTAANVEALQHSGVGAVFLHGGSIADAYRAREQWPDLRMGVALRGPYFSTPEETRSDFARARELALPISVHAGVAGYPGAVHQLAESDLLGPDVNFAHGSEFSTDELGMVAATGGTLSVSPTVDMSMALGTYPALGSALERGVAVGLAADTIASAGTDLFSEMRLALAAERSRGTCAGEPTTLGHRDVLQVATHGGAAVWGLGEQTGTLTPGKTADIIMVDMRAPHLDGFGDPVLAVLLNAGPSDVETVLAAGLIVKASGRLVGGTHVETARALLKDSRERLRQS